ncbi:MAG TPA: GDP-mannose 4,6-dehydratase [Candidatus Acidoferrales bacterium]|nr:GDP-mannose 4,6-dehydratase [Candidatus Acidoferrales bacterium]
MTKHALITGVTGQDGSYLAEYLLEQGYKVFGLVRRSSSPNVERVGHLLEKITLIPGDLLDDHSLVKALEQSQAEEVYNLAAQSFVATSWNQPIFTAEVTGVGVARLLEAIRKVNPKIRMYQASSSEQYGAARTTPQNEDTAFHPRSPYAVAKAYAHHITINYRESYGLFACCGICFNHESPRRGLEFVTRKITHAAARIKLGLQKELKLGNLRAVRDWGFAGDYVRGMWRMLQQPQAEEFVFATGECHSVEDLVAAAFEHAGLDWKDHVSTEASLLRPADVEHLRGDATKAREKLGWRPDTSFAQLVHMMVDADLQRVRAEALAGAAAARG